MGARMKREENDKRRPCEIRQCHLSMAEADSGGYQPMPTSRQLCDGLEDEELIVG